MMTMYKGSGDDDGSLENMSVIVGAQLIFFIHRLHVSVPLFILNIRERTLTIFPIVYKHII